MTIWRQVLDLESIALDDDFFALGGDSLHATSLMAEIETVSGKRLPTSVLLAAPTVRALAKRAEFASALPGNFVSLRDGEGQAMLFMIHGWCGTITHFLALVGRLRFEGQIVGLQGDEQTGATQSHDSVVGLAKHYVDLMTRTYPGKKYVLAGYSAGGILAYVIATELRARGISVELLIAIDSLPHGVPLRRRGGMLVPHLRTRLRVHVKRLSTLDIREVAGYLWHRSRAVLFLAQKVVRPVEAGGDKYGDLLARHRLEQTDTRVALIQCDQTIRSLVHAWRYLVAENVRDYPLSGDHEQMLKGENVGVLAQKVDTILADFDI